MRVTNRIKVLTYYLQLLKTHTVTLLCFSTHFLQTEALSQKNSDSTGENKYSEQKKVQQQQHLTSSLSSSYHQGKILCEKKRLISDIIISKRHLRSQQAQHNYRYRNSPSPQNKEKKQ
jgi:hypothetical protein